MAIKYGFYNSVDGDRKYNSEDFGKIFDGIIRDGVFESVLDNFQITILSGLSVSVGKGKAWFNKTWLENDANYPVTFTEAEVLLDRIDAVVLEFNSIESVRANTIKVITGTPSSTPQKPTLTHTDTVNQYPLCYVTIPAKATSLVVGNLDVRIGSTDCPYVVIQSGEIPSLTEINKLINDVAALDTKIDDTVEDLSFVKTDGNGEKMLFDDGTYKDLSPVFLGTITTSGYFNPANFPTIDDNYAFALYGGGGGGGISFTNPTADDRGVYMARGGGGGAGGKTITKRIKVITPPYISIGAGGRGGRANYNGGMGDPGGTTSIRFGVNDNKTVIEAEGGLGGSGAYTFSDSDETFYRHGDGGTGGLGTITEIKERTMAGSNGTDSGPGIGANSDVGTGGQNGQNATGYAAGGSGAKENTTPGHWGPTDGAKGSPGVVQVYGYTFKTEV